MLRLYLRYDLLAEAAELVLEYVDALLGKGHQYFGIEVIHQDCFRRDAFTDHCLQLVSRWFEKTNMK